jgi:hypothetical protein
MNWAAITALLLPALQPLIVTGLTLLFTFIGSQLFHLLMASRFKSVAATIVAAVEDQHDALDGSGKLKLAIDNLVSKLKVGGVQIISNTDAELYVREAYIALIKPLDGLKVTAVVSSPSTTPAA